MDFFIKHWMNGLNVIKNGHKEIINEMKYFPNKIHCNFIMRIYTILVIFVEFKLIINQNKTI